MLRPDVPPRAPTQIGSGAAKREEPKAVKRCVGVDSVAWAQAIARADNSTHARRPLAQVTCGSTCTAGAGRAAGREAGRAHSIRALPQPSTVDPNRAPTVFLSLLAIAADPARALVGDDVDCD